MNTSKLQRRRHLAAALLAALMIVSLVPGAPLPPPVAVAQASELFIPRPIDVSSETGPFATGDLDGDGDLDVVLGRSLLLNDGRGAFQTRTFNIPSAGWPDDLALGDMDSDGWLDIVAIGTNGNAEGFFKPIWVFRNDQRGGFGGLPVELRAVLPAVNVSIPVMRIALGDMSGDGRLDIVCTCDQGRVYTNQGDGSFTVGAPVDPAVRFPSRVAIGQLDSDSSLDLILAGVRGGSYPVAQIFFNAGQGAFRAGRMLTAGLNNTVAVAIGDVTGDGLLDAVVQNRRLPPEVPGGSPQDRGNTLVFVNRGGSFGDPVSLEPRGIANALALGDIDSDGLVDLIVGQEREAPGPFNPEHPGQSVVFRSTGNGTFAEPVAVNPAGGTTSAIGAADLTGDGALDVLLDDTASGGLRAYVNARPRSFSAPVLPGPPDATRLIPADLTGDGRLDLLSTGQTIDYFIQNEDGFFTPGPTVITASSAEVGDMTGDGALDLVVAQPGAPFALLVNNRTGGFSPGGSVPTLPVGASITAFAVGDFTGDGPLDVVTAGDALRMYRNDDGGSFTLASTRAAAPSPAILVADMDSDRALDLVLWSGAFVQVYLNDRTGGFRPGTSISSPDGTAVRSVAVGELELVRGNLPEILLNTAAASWIFEENGFGFYINTSPALRNPEGQSTAAAAIGDLNGDGANDIVLSTLAEQGGTATDTTVLLLNNGDAEVFTRTIVAQTQIPARQTPPFREPPLSPGRLTIADIDANGANDILVAGETTFSRQYRGQVWPPTPVNDTPPSVRVGQPGTTRPGEGYVTPEFLGGPTIAVPFTLFDAEGDPVSRVVGQYSLDDGVSWQLAYPRDPAAASNLAATPAGQSHSFVWDLAAGGDPGAVLIGQSDTVRFRVNALHTPRPRQPPAGGAAWRPSVSGPYQYAAQASTSTPFRARGTIARVVSARSPGGEPGALVYQLRPGLFGIEGEPLPRGYLGEPLVSDSQGYVPSQRVIIPGDSLVAVLPISQTDKLTYALTSAAPSPTGLATTPITSQTLGVQTLTVSPANPLLLLNLTVSVEWDNLLDQEQRQRLQRNLLRASQILYDWTDGQVALGAVTIGLDGALWSSADIRVYAANNLRPNAAQGGIVTSPMTLTYTVDGQPNPVEYEPGHIRIGATWASGGDPGDNVDEDWSRALAHELGHYAFFLDETYLGRAGDLLVPIAGCPSPMADPYIEGGSEFRPASSWTGECLTTLQQRVTGRAEWDQIKAIYNHPGIAPGFDFLLKAPPTLNANPGPSTLPLMVTTFAERSFREDVSVAIARDIGVIPPDSGRYEPSPSARAFIYRYNSFFGDELLDLTDLGAPTTGLVTVRGMQPDDRVCVLDPELELQGCGTRDSALTLVARPGWRPELSVTPETSVDATGATAMTLRFELPAASVAAPGSSLPASLSVQLFPRDDAYFDRPVTALVREGEGPAAVYRGTLTGLPVVEEAYLRLWAPDGSGREAVVSYSIGFNPAPRRKPPRRTRRNAPAVSPDGQATLFSEGTSVEPGGFFALQTVNSLPALPAWATVVGQGYRLISSDPAMLATPDRPLALSLGYAEGSVPPGLENDVRAIFHDGAGWRELPTRLNTARNEAAVTAEKTPGIYALVTSLRLRLNGPAWSLIYSYPGEDQALPSALAGAAGGYTMVYGYDEGDQSDPPDPWKLYSPIVPAWVNDLPGLSNGASYWIRTTAPVTVPVRLPEASLQQAQDVLPPPPMTAYGVLGPLWSVPALAGLTVDARIDEVVCGSTKTRALPDGQVGFALNVIARGDAHGTACGALGAPVSFVFRDGDRELGRIAAVWDNSAPLALRPTRVFLPSLPTLFAGGADLVVARIEVLPPDPDAGQPAEVRVTIRNQGGLATERPFWVDLYVDPTARPTAGKPWPELSALGASWRVYGLPAGATRVLSTLLPGDPLDPGQSFANFTGFPEARTYALYAQVDSYGGDQGAVPEANERNNLLGPQPVIVFLP